MKKLLGSILLLVVTLGMAFSQSSVQAQGRWVKLAPFPEPTEEVLGASAGGKLYVLAGLGPGYKPMGLVYEYDPATDKWTKKKPMALPAHHLAVVEHRGKIYVFGGFVLPKDGPPAWDPIDNAWEYDPAVDSWKALANMPTKRGAGGAAAVGDKIYVIGGATTGPGAKESALLGTRSHRSVDAVEEYDLATNTWHARSPMPTARNHFAIGTVNNKVYVIGGRIGAAFITVASNTDVTEEYDPATDTWSALKARMPTPRSALAYAVHGGRVYVAGGEFQDARMMAAFRALEGYDPAGNRWISLPQMPLPRHGLAGAVVGNRLHLVSGDLQSAGTGHMMHTDSHDAFEFENAAK